MAVVIAGVIGNLLTVGLAVLFGERIRAWWHDRRALQGRQPSDSERSQRVERLLNRYGLPALAVVGPILTGTQLAAMLAVALGTERRSTFIWIAGGTIVWAVTAAVLTITGSALVRG